MEFLPRRGRGISLKPRSFDHIAVWWRRILLILSSKYAAAHFELDGFKGINALRVSVLAPWRSAPPSGKPAKTAAI